MGYMSSLQLVSSLTFLSMDSSASGSYTVSKGSSSGAALQAPRP